MNLLACFIVRDSERFVWFMQTHFQFDGSDMRWACCVGCN